MDRWELLGAAGSLVTLFLPIFIVISGQYWRATQDREKARRMAEHRMNARLLRLDI
jgi:hypothetical protein